jgi:hypothetical protein
MPVQGRIPEIPLSAGMSGKVSDEAKWPDYEDE